ncbi:MAG: hypothetical protein E7500_05340 [Ruminococcus sp.]|nr:hypothetical protein [Ruminococcus sp.]
MKHFISAVVVSAISLNTLLLAPFDTATASGSPDSGLQNIIGNMIAKGEAEKMIVIFPYIYTSKDMPYFTGINDIKK